MGGQGLIWDAAKFLIAGAHFQNVAARGLEKEKLLMWLSREIRGAKEVVRMTGQNLINIAGTTYVVSTISVPTWLANQHVSDARDGFEILD